MVSEKQLLKKLAQLKAKEKAVVKAVAQKKRVRVLKQKILLAKVRGATGVRKLSPSQKKSLKAKAKRFVSTGTYLTDVIAFGKAKADRMAKKR